jgi:D-glycero-D-manno-heptose 1,7-bisphosphate phosphatase
VGIGEISRNRALLLDRDGVINRAIVRDGKPYPPASVGELDILPGVAEALARSRVLGYLNIVITNQPDISRGTQTREAVEAMNGALMRDLPIDDVFVCYHDDADSCACRKPRPGLIYVIGDRWRDIEAGIAAACRTILVDYGYNEGPPSRPPEFRVGSLLEAVTRIEMEQKGCAE